MTAERSVLVIGGGLSGLTAAYRLQQAGVDVTVLERSDGLMGRAVSTKRDGFILDRGADAVVEGYTHYVQLVRDLGLTSDLHVITNPAATIRDGRVITYSGSVRSMLRTSLLSWTAKARIGAGVARINSVLAQSASSALHQLGHLDDPAVSARQYSDRLFGREATDYLVEPVVRLINGFRAEDASLLEVICGLSLAGTPNLALRGGIGTLSETLESRVDVRRGVDVLSVRESGDGVEVAARTRYGDKILRADGCVLATMLHDAAEIHPATAEATAEMRANLVHVDLLKVQLAYAAPTRSNAFLIQTPVCEEFETMGVFLDHNKHPDRAPAGHSLISVYADSYASTEWMSYPESEVVAWGQAKAEMLMPELRGHLEFAEIGRWPAMGHANRPGSYRDAAAARARLAQGPVFSGGDWFSKTSQETAVAGGDRAAQAVLANWAALESGNGSLAHSTSSRSTA